MLKLMTERDFVRVVFDQRGTPTWARDLAAAILALIASPRPEYGTYHFTNEGETSWYEFALAIRDEAKAGGLLPKGCRVDPIAASEYQTKARRPAYSVLSKNKIRQTFGIEPPEWRDSLREYFLSIGEQA
jgi:dTDP-4-dehydrorhamnose reductase